MDFSWTDEQEGLWDEISTFAKDELVHNLVERDRDGIFIEENWQAIAAKGIFGYYHPEKYGGRGQTVVTTVRILEALGYGCPDNGLTLAINGQMWAVQAPLAKWGTETQKEKYLTRLIDGSFKGAHGMTEAGAGSDSFNLSTTATKVDGGYLLNGQKIYVGLAPICDMILTFATVNPEIGRWGVTAFIIDPDQDGVILSEPKEKMGLRTSPLGTIEYQDAFVPDENVLGREGAGAGIFSACMDYERSFMLASHVGSMARQLDETIAFANDRKLNGQSIGKHQAVSHRIANMKVRLETARLFLYKCASLVDQGNSIPMDASMANLVMSELFVENSLDAIRTHGGRGYLTEYGIERDLRDAVGGVIYSGTSDIQRNWIAGLLGL